MDKQADFVQLNAHPFHPRGNTLSCSGHLNSTVLQLQQKHWFTRPYCEH